MTNEEAIKWIRHCMCEGRLVGNTTPIIDEKWQAGLIAIEALSAIDDIKAEIENDIDKDRSRSSQSFIDGFETGCNQCLMIIDKHISGKEGDNA